MKKLEAQEIEAALKTLPGWSLLDGKLRREFRFASFIEAFGWMTSVAIVAQSHEHHPEWFNVYDRVRVDLTTHDVGGISERDLKLAAEMNRLALARG